MSGQPTNPPSVEHAANWFYEIMACRAYNFLVLFWEGRSVWDLNIPMPCHFPWDEFIKLNPVAPAAIHCLEGELHYQFSEAQLSWAVMKLRGEPYKKVFGPPITQYGMAGEVRR